MTRMLEKGSGSVNKLSASRRAQILGIMVEGVSLRAIGRLTGASKNTIVRLMEDAGEAFSAYQDQTLRNLPCKRLQLDEIWSFIGVKARNRPFSKRARDETAGDVWCWVGICADTKLVPSWLVGDREGETAIRFVCDLSHRLAKSSAGDQRWS